MLQIDFHFQAKEKDHPQAGVVFFLGNEIVI